MREEEVHSLVLGAGPSGLGAAYTLAKAGLKPIVLERDQIYGGLMKRVQHKDFSVDVGRKELYNRLAKVDNLWADLLGDNFREYPHRGAYLYEGNILEMSREYKGFRRGMSWTMFLRCIFGFAFSRLNPFAGKPKNVEQYFYQTRGRLLTRIASQGFQEKLGGTPWSELPMPENYVAEGEKGVIGTFIAAAKRAISTKQVNTFKGIWRHPAKGTGQICDALAKGIMDEGGAFGFGAKIQKMNISQNRVDSVIAEVNGETICYKPQFLVSSIPLEILIPMLGRKVPDSYLEAKKSPTQRRTALLVYLFLKSPPNFPHAYLQVTCKSTRIGRITNYSGFNSDMVPEGKGCLCCEYFCYGDDELLKLTDNELAKQTFDYCVSAGLMTADSFSESQILKFPGADSSQNRHNWITSMRMGLLDEVKPFHNLYHIARTDLDIATLAGIEAAEAIISGDRSEFDQHFDPTKIGIRSETKAFEFKVPKVENN